VGKYIGIDVDEEMLNWCRKNFDSERFSFHRCNHESKAYKGMDHSNGQYELPLPDASADFVFSTSLYTHLLEKEVVNYTRESSRVLKPGAYMAMFCFTMDQPPPTYGGRHTFSHKIGNAHVESLEVPEAAVAYDESYLCGMAREAGFRTAEVATWPQGWQHLLLCQK
jgi:ubiquinone/menaquinone biosynthesis C-methylase UbiE